MIASLKLDGHRFELSSTRPGVSARPVENPDGLVPGIVHVQDVLRAPRRQGKPAPPLGYSFARFNESNLLRESSHLLRVATSHINAYLYAQLHNKSAYRRIIARYADIVNSKYRIFLIFLNGSFRRSAAPFRQSRRNAGARHFQLFFVSCVRRYASIISS